MLLGIEDRGRGGGVKGRIWNRWKGREGEGREGNGRGREGRRG